jgi:tetratricopeptide (TPR) repeat protein
MGNRHSLHKRVVAAGLAILSVFVPATARADRLDELFADLQKPDLPNYQAVEREIHDIWGHSGSAAMDFLLERGRADMDAGNYDAAIGHFSAVIDHAPDWAEAWNDRAVAYYNAGMLGQSLDDIHHVLALDPRHFGALSGLAMIFEDIGHPAEALKVWQAVRALNPHLPGLDETLKRLEEQVGGQSL